MNFVLLFSKNQFCKTAAETHNQPTSKRKTLLPTHRNLYENQCIDQPNSIILEITHKQPNFLQINTAFVLLFFY